MTKLDQDAVASTLRKGMRLVQEMTELATEAAELLLRREAPARWNIHWSRLLAERSSYA